MPSPRERRRFPRYDIARPGVLDGFRLFETMRLSIGGALIRLPVELALAQRVHVAFDLDEGDSFRSAADVVFVGPDMAEEGLFRIGLSFVGTTDEDHQRLQRFIDREAGVATTD